MVPCGWQYCLVIAVQKTMAACRNFCVIIDNYQLVLEDSILESGVKM
jgi:hypothetical protein